MQNTKLEQLENQYEEISSDIRRKLLECNLTYEALFDVAAHAMLINKIYEDTTEQFKSELAKSDNAILSERASLFATLDREMPKVILSTIKKTKSAQGKSGGTARVENDPKTKDLKEIEAEFHKVSSQFKRHGYGAEFCRKMQDKYPNILDPKTIPKLVTRLKKSIPLQPVDHPRI